jgi:hypothetical protein
MRAQAGVVVPTRTHRGPWLETALALFALAIGPANVRGQVYEWTDALGDRHYDTSLERVPEDRRADARLVVSGESAQPAPATPEADDPPEAVAESADAAEDGFDSGWDSGFEAGWVAGYRMAIAEQPECPAEPEIVILETPVTVDVPRYDPSGAYYRSPYGGTLTRPFDDGASRGLTGRKLMQTQRALERGW